MDDAVQPVQVCMASEDSYTYESVSDMSDGKAKEDEIRGKSLPDPRDRDQDGKRISPFDRQDRRRSPGVKRSRERSRRSRERSPRGGRERKGRSRAPEQDKRKEVSRKEKPPGKEQPMEPAEPPRSQRVQLRSAKPQREGVVYGQQVKCPHCQKKLTSQVSGQKLHMYLNLYCLRCQMWNQLPQKKKTHEEWERTLERAQALRAKREEQDQREAEAVAQASKRSLSKKKELKPKPSKSLPAPVPLESSSGSGGDEEPEPAPAASSKKTNRHSTGSGRNVIINIA